MADALMRQIEMLRILPRTGKTTSQQLHRQLAELGYSTTERTVQRDLQMLAAAIPIECDDQSKPHGWRWSPAAVVWTLPGLSLTEALAFQLLEKFSADLLPASIAKQLQAHFRTARIQASREVGTTVVRNWLKKVRSVQPSQPLLRPAVADAVLQAVQESLMQDRCLRIRYRDIKAEHRLVHPLGLVQHGQAFYLVVNYDGYEDVRLIAVHRILEAKVADEPAITPAGFDLDRYIDEGGLGFGEVGETVQLVLHMFNNAGSHLKETGLSKDQVVTDVAPGEHRIEATVQLTRRLRWWLLAFGSDVEVLGPPALRDEIESQLQQAIKRYQRPGRA